MIWSTQPPRITKTRADSILHLKPGTTALARNNIQQPVDAFTIFFTDEIIDQIVHFTNLHAEWLIEHKKITEFVRTHRVEMKAFLGLLILAGVLRGQHDPIHCLWSKDPIFNRPIFTATMSRNRFEELYRIIRFDNKYTREEREQTDRIAAIREIFDEVVQKFRSMYNPTAHLTIDEQLVGYRGRCGFVMYMPKKPDKFGLKHWALCDATNSYCLNLQLYSGRGKNQPRDENQGQRVVLELTDYLPSGYNITTDNFFTSIPLAIELLSRPNKMTIVGTLKLNKQQIPKELLNGENRANESSYFAFTTDMTIVSYIQGSKDKSKRKNVMLLSTMHHDPVIDSRYFNKPHIILYYNLTKGGVDSLDEKVKTYRCRRRSSRWSFAVFQNLIDITLLNGHIIFTQLFPEWHARDADQRSLFVLDVAKTLILPHILERDRDHLQSRVINAMNQILGYEIPRYCPPALIFCRYKMRTLALMVRIPLNAICKNRMLIVLYELVASNVHDQWI